MHYLIVHGLVKIHDKYLLIKRTEIKRGKPNSFPLYWDIPGGMVEDGELPQDAVIRETKEEVNLDIEVGNIIHEDSNYDEKKKSVYTRLVYNCLLNNDQDESNIILCFRMFSKERRNHDTLRRARCPRSYRAGNG